MRTTAEHHKGIALMVGATLCWATAGILVRTMDSTDGWKITFWRSLFMTAFMLAVLGFQHGARLPRRRRERGTPAGL
jgi:EamA domain-containing membrane protein RarD